MTRQSETALEGSNAGVSLADKLIETIRNLTSNRDLVMTRLATLNGDGLKTASIMEVAGMYRSLVAQVAVLYDTDDFQNIIAPYIERRFKEIGSPSLTPGTIGSYIFGCYLAYYGLETLNKFCTPICAASIRVPNRDRVNMRCTEKVIWTDGGDTPVFVLIDEDPENSHNGKVFIPWVGDATTFTGLTQGAVDEIRSLGVENVEIYGQLFNNRYIQLLTRKALSDIDVVERIRLRAIDYVNSKNGGLNVDKIPESPESPESPRSPGSPEKMTTRADDEQKASKKEETNALTTAMIVLVFVAAVLGVTALLYRRKSH